jgi:YD repeat-containing protein
MAVAAGAVPIGAGAVEIQRPKIEIMDSLGVNLATGQVTQNLTPVSIGGPMGLAYRMSIYANEARWGAEGFHTNYQGEARAVVLSFDPTYSPRSVYQVSDDSGSSSFKVLVNGVVQESIANVPMPYTYEAVGDTRHTLVTTGPSLTWTKPDGTVVRFERGTSTKAGDPAGLAEIVFPNGLAIRPGGAGVTSNTGFQLKPIMVPDNRPFDKVDNPNLIGGVPPASSSAASGWSGSNPKYVKALNTAIEYCAPAPATCAPTRTWPTATIDYPAGMPRTLFIGDSIISVTDASGGVTHLRYRAYDLAYDKNGQVIAPYTPNTQFSPRLVGFRPPGRTLETLNYDYINLFVPAIFSEGGWNHRAQTSGVTKSATNIGRTAFYTMVTPTMGGQDYRNNASGDGGVSVVQIQPKLQPGNPDLIAFVDTEEGRLVYEGDTPRNFPLRFEKISAPHERYQYDARGNLIRIQFLIDGVYRTQMEAQYPATCTAATRKTCNQAEWIEDAKHNRTSFTYHAQSGELASVTAPPDADGKTAQERYEYTQLSARYFDAYTGVRINGSGIWLRTAKRSCIDSNFSSGGCAAGDEVVTRFEYNHDNLFMTGMTVTSPGGTTLRTCYQYDIYGNRIGTTTPNANRTSCN